MKEYLCTTEEVLAAQNVSSGGLSAAEAGARFSEAGANELQADKKKSLFRRVLEQVSDPMVLVLIAAGVVSGIFKEYADMVIILIVVALNAVLGIFQESKAEKAIDALQKMSAPHCRVIRGGNAAVIASSEVVPGDIVLLDAGDSVPADLRLIEAASLKIEEAALTGESVPSEKTPDAIKAPQNGEVPLGDRKNMAYMGTNVTYGRGRGVVIATGMKTEMGNIAGILSGTGENKTPLQKKLSGLSKILSIAVIGICAFIFVLNVIRSGGFASGRVFDAFLTAVSLAVAAIPEGLVVVVTVLLSIGVTRMSEQNAIIRRLTAVETLGSTEVICSDKTGTLTQNKMTVVEQYGDIPMLAAAMLFCNDVETDADGEMLGDPTEIAKEVFGLRHPPENDQPRLGELPFDSDRKLMSTFNRDGKMIRQYVTGAPDEVLRKCNRIIIDGKVVPITSEHQDAVLAENKRMAGKALRVLAGAVREYQELPERPSPEMNEVNLTFAGLIGMIDPIRPEVKDAIETCRTAGIRAVMITGDHRDTAVAIAKDLGILSDESQAITGAELNEMNDEVFLERIRDLVVYARVQPEHKVRIVNMWEKIGKITAMTGDGVNDAPALKSADIGVGMGITGTDVTKNVADMVLADDNFATIVCAVEEGRRIYGNIRKAIQFLLASNLSEVVAIFISALVNIRLFAPIHILWINLITDTFPAMALGMEKAESDSMRRPPRDPKEGIFAGGLGIDVVWQGIAIGLLTLLSFFIGNRENHMTGMTMAFLTLSMCEIFHSFNMRSRDKSIFMIKSANKFLVGAMLLSVVLTAGVIYIPGLNTVFQLTALPLADFFIAFGLAFVILPAVEAVKLIRRLQHKK